MLFLPNTSFFINQLSALLNFRLRDAGQPGKNYVCTPHVLLFKKSQDKKMTVAMN